MFEPVIYSLKIVLHKKIVFHVHYYYIKYIMGYSEAMK